MSYRSLFLPLALAVSVAHADTLYKCIDSDGHTTYTNQKASTKNCSVLLQDKPVSTFSPPPKAKSSTPTPSDFPRVTPEAQKNRDGDRRKILQDELAAERDKLENAKKTLGEQESERLGGERNYQKYLDRVKPYQDEVELHQRNVESLQKELDNLR